MFEDLTDQQKQAVTDRGGRLLVSAAAGSGKTKVLVDRLLSYLTDPVAPANLDEFLIITYTKAAAAELRGKIAAKLTERIAQEPENRHLQQQMQRLYLTNISTVHSFCADILRQYAYQLDIAADFRVAEENECVQLRQECMDRLLENAYDTADTNPGFRAFVDSQGLGRDDRLVPEILLKVYDSARCHLDPEKWLNDCLQKSDVSDVRDVSQTVWGEKLVNELFDFLDLQIEAIESCAQKAAVAEGMEKPATLFADTAVQLRQLRRSESWDEIIAGQNVDFGRLTFSKKCTDLQLQETMKAVRNACKKGLEKRLRSFKDGSGQMLADMAEAYPAVQGIVDTVKQFGKEYDRAKRSRHIMDFGDLEHRMLDLLLGSSRAGQTAAAREIGSRFREVMVDEYQDSNAVQDAIFMALTQQKQNCFMVGDVKQSIYQFRLADPDIFLKKYEQYVPADEAKPGQGRKVLLSKNFRSGGAVLSAVNDVFDCCMSEKVGGLEYGEAESLVEGAFHAPLGEPEVELYAVDVQESTYDEEAAFVAQRIEQLLDGKHMIRYENGLRPIKAEDIAILLRSPGSMGQHFRLALEGKGIRCATGGGEDLLQTQEVATLRAILQTVSNPRQDIPLLAALASPVFGFTANDLAAFRGKRRKGSIYDALAADDSEKSKAFLDVLRKLRREKRMMTLSQLLETVFTLTRMDSLYAAMPGGETRKRNLQIFYQLASDYENGGQRDLEHFLEHLQAMEGKGLVAAGEQGTAGAVTIMSIHKSKGLEFPVVFVCGLSREFNRESTRGQVLSHQNLGLGLSAVDRKNRVRYPTVAKRAIAAEITADSLSEELRVLYVALTRARDRLIMTYASDNLEKDVLDIALRMGTGNSRLLTQNVVCPGEWVLLTALRRTESGALFDLGCRPAETTVSQIPWKVQVVTAQVGTLGEMEQEETAQLPADAQNKLQHGLSFRYPYAQATGAPSKQTATQRKGRQKDAESAEYAALNKTAQRTWRNASFREQSRDGKDYGNAYHAVMEHIRYEACADEVSISREIQRLVDVRLLTQEQAALVNSKDIAAFFSSPLGHRLMGGNVVREFKFSVLDDGTHYGDGLAGEKVLLQGVVDCALIEPDGITIVDFKTDRVTEKTLHEAVDRYRLQVQTYADAMARIYSKPVKGKYLYFFHMERLESV